MTAARDYLRDPNRDAEAVAGGGRWQAPPLPVASATVNRFFAKVQNPAEADGCWSWTGGVNDSGYGIFAIDRKRKGARAHRWAYEYLVGPIPEGFELDHLCRNTLCVNPAHLEPVTHRENVLRGTCPSAQNARKTSCKYGHPYNVSNTRYTQRGRICRICRRAETVRETAARRQSA